ncbi:MAG TPA: DUF3240 domain-containing protein [Chromatiaceae bacterium]|nr:DUF3240 domain-containing protein [Chromatiaceae bacterium]
MSMNESETTRDHDEALLSLVLPPPLSDPVVDWLLEQPEVTGFISLPVNGHGGSEHSMSAAEKVAGYRRGWMIQTHLPRASACELLGRLKQQFSGSDIHYWMTPLIVGGHLD